MEVYDRESGWGIMYQSDEKEEEKAFVVGGKRGIVIHDLSPPRLLGFFVGREENAEKVYHIDLVGTARRPSFQTQGSSFRALAGRGVEERKREHNEALIHKLLFYLNRASALSRSKKEPFIHDGRRSPTVAFLH